MTIIRNIMLLIGASVGGACGDNDTACSGEGTNVVSLRLFGPTLLFAYRNSGDEWQALESSDSGLHQICVDDEYVVTVVCESLSQGLFLRQHYGRASDDRDVALGLCAPLPQEQRFVVSGEMLQPGGVFIGGGGLLSQQAPFVYELSVAVGEYSLVASDGYGLSPEDARLVIRRDLTVDKSQIQEPIDLDLEGRPFSTVSVGFGNPIVGESISTSVELTIDSHGATVFTSTSDIVGVADSAMLLPGDSEVVTLVASSNDNGNEYVRIGSELFVGLRPEFELFPRLSGVNYAVTSSGLMASWAELPVSDFTDVQLLGLDGADLSFVSASRGWLEQHDSSSITLDSSTPGFDPAWTVVPSTSTFIVTKESPTLRLSTSEHHSF